MLMKKKRLFFVQNYVKHPVPSGWVMTPHLGPCQVNGLELSSELKLAENVMNVGPAVVLYKSFKHEIKEKHGNNDSSHVQKSASGPNWPLSLTWINVNPNMDK